MHNILIDIFPEQVFDGMVPESDFAALPITFLRVSA